MRIGAKTGTTHPWGEADSVYAEIGGADAVRRLVETFYDIVEDTSPVLSDMLPADTTDTRQKLFEFMSGWMGGPPLYHQRRGHPALRIRHASFSIGELEAAEWVRCMNDAIGRTVSGQAAVFLSEQLTNVAAHLRNRA